MKAQTLFRTFPACGSPVRTDCGDRSRQRGARPLVASEDLRPRGTRAGGLRETEGARPADRQAAGARGVSAPHRQATVNGFKSSSSCSYQSSRSAACIQRSVANASKSTSKMRSTAHGSNHRVDASRRRGDDFPPFPDVSWAETATARHAFGLPSPFQGSPGKISISRVRTLSAAASMSHS